MNSESKQLLTDILGCQVNDLPTLPEVASQVSTMIARDRANAEKLAEVIARDPVMAARLLKMANSAAYGLRTEVRSVGHAVVVLGFKEVSNLTLSIAAFSSIGAARPMRKRVQRSALWSHSQFVGLTTEAMARHEFKIGSGYYVHGLIHDIGKVALDAFRPQDFDKVLDKFERGGISWIDAEKEIFGADHCQVGRALTDYWGFPDSMASAVGDHHQPWASKVDKQAACLVHLADLAAQRLGHFSYKSNRAHSMPEPLAPNAAQLAQGFGWTFDDLLVERLQDHIRSVKDTIAALN